MSMNIFFLVVTGFIIFFFSSVLVAVHFSSLAQCLRSPTLLIEKETERERLIGCSLIAVAISNLEKTEYKI